MRNGIGVLGNILVDVLYEVDVYPRIGELSRILSIPSMSSGGLCTNVSKDLARLDSELDVYAYGCIGNDDLGEFIKEGFREYDNINTDNVRVLNEYKTSNTLVMTDKNTRQRTFFYAAGAGERIDEDFLDLDKIDVKIMHMGYVLMLDLLDAPCDEYGTVMARLLSKLKEKGIKTSIDLVSETSDRVRSIAVPSFKYTDYLIINEIEAENVTGIKLRDEGRLIEDNMESALRQLKELGVSEWCVVHCPECAFAVDENDVYHKKPSVKLEKSFIKGTVGAGDAFCSGVLLAAYKDMKIEQALTLGHAAAICALSKDGSSEGILPYKEALKLLESFEEN